MPTMSHWGKEFEGTARLDSVPTDLVVAFDTAVSAKDWALSLALLQALSTQHVHRGPCATELAACIRLLADDAPRAALARLVFSPLAPFRELDPAVPTSLIDALADELAARRAPEWTALALAQADDPSDRRAIEAMERLDELEPGDLGTIEALESHLFDLASEAKDAGWYGLSAWVASRQAELDFEEDTIRQFGRSALDMAPDLPLTHALWIRTLLNLDDDAGAAQAFREAFLHHETEPQWVWALLRSTSADGEFPELHERAYAILCAAFADDDSAVRAVAEHQERLAHELSARQELASVTVLPVRQRAAQAARVALDVARGEGPIREVTQFVAGLSPGAPETETEEDQIWIVLGGAVFFAVVLGVLWLLAI